MFCNGMVVLPDGRPFIMGGTLQYDPFHGELRAPVASLSAASVIFGDHAVGTSSAAQSVTLTNSGNAALNIASIAIGGANSSDFSQTNSCGAGVLAPTAAIFPKPILAGPVSR